MKNKKVLSLEYLEKKMVEEEMKTVKKEKVKHKTIDDYFNVRIIKRSLV